MQQSAHLASRRRPSNFCYKVIIDEGQAGGFCSLFPTLCCKNQPILKTALISIYLFIDHKKLEDIFFLLLLYFYVSPSFTNDVLEVKNHEEAKF